MGKEIKFWRTFNPVMPCEAPVNLVQQSGLGRTNSLGHLFGGRSCRSSRKCLPLVNIQDLREELKEFLQIIKFA